LRSQDSPFARSVTHAPPLQKPLAAQSESTPQLEPQAALVPEQRAGAHAGGAAVAGRTVHVPLAVAPSAAEQTSHVPEQAESQHTPSTHAPVAHARPRGQARPLVRRTTHAPAELQYAFGAQSESAAQVVAHELVVPLQV
jgi:hypothetical protein